jgi:choline dehydrogenase-like flavoprotein
MTIAHRLRDQSLSILVLDSGFREYDGRAQQLNEGTNTGLDYYQLDATRLRMLGGSSNHWEGSCNDLDDIDFEDRPWVSRGGWPITKDDLRPYYTVAHDYLQLGPYDYSLKSWAQRLQFTPPDWIRDGLEGHVTHHSPPTRFGEVYGADLEAAPNVRVLLGATALAVNRGEDRLNAERLTVGRFGQDPIEVQAKRFVLALGGVENARFLLLNEMGNEHDQVGRYFMEHPYFRLMLLAPSGAFLSSYPGLAKKLERSGHHITPSIRFSEEILRRDQFQNCRVTFEPTSRYEAAAGIESFHELGRDRSAADEVMYHIGNLLLDIDMLAEAASRQTFKRRILSSANDVSVFTIGCMFEQLPNPDSRVTLGETKDDFAQRRTQLSLQMSEADRIAAGRFVKAVSRTYGQVGIGRIRSFVADRFAPWPPRRVSWGSHHMGTTRMSDDPKRGVVDRNLRLHGMSNVFVAGSSVFPTGGHVPPTLTIVALSLRLADHLMANAP